VPHPVSTEDREDRVNSRALKVEVARVGRRAHGRWLTATGSHRFLCPACQYRGAFVPAGGSGRQRRSHARCPACGAAERHRLQIDVLDRVLPTLSLPPEALAVHFAPEPTIGARLRAVYGQVVTADLHGRDVDLAADLRELPFEDGAVHLVYASHVLEHVDDDARAIREIRRVLAPGGIAILPVPILCSSTVEYGASNPHEHQHVRAPGLDYFDRYRAAFSRVDVYDSLQFPLEHQLLLYEDRSCYPTPERPLRTAMTGGPFPDYVPVCWR
jgi:SAM-dependent methyltransferase